jgi:hypothetical protein
MKLLVNKVNVTNMTNRMALSVDNLIEVNLVETHVKQYSQMMKTIIMI